MKILFIKNSYFLDLDWNGKTRLTIQMYIQFWKWIVNHNPIQQTELQYRLSNSSIQSSNTLHTGLTVYKYVIIKTITIKKWPLCIFIPLPPVSTFFSLGGLSICRLFFQWWRLIFTLEIVDDFAPHQRDVVISNLVSEKHSVYRTNIRAIKFLELKVVWVCRLIITRINNLINLTQASASDTVKRTKTKHFRGSKILKIDSISKVYVINAHIL